MLYTTGLMFPLSIGISKILKVDWQSKGNPLGQLGFVLNLAQLVYFPMIFWAMIENKEAMVLFFAIITAAHFFPYGWLYETKVFYIMSPVVSLLLFFLHLVSLPLWMIPVVMIMSLMSMIAWLSVDYKKKIESNQSSVEL